MKYIKYTLVVFLCIFSFYISDYAIIMVENMSPIMKQVKGYDAENLAPVNAIIEDNTIIPGKNGKVINERESYLKMNEFGTFNETFLVYDYIKPDVSLYDNLDKIIINTNNKDEVALIIDDETIEEYLSKENIKYTKIIKDKESIKNSTEYINGNMDEKEFNKLNSYLKKNKLNSKMCLVDASNINACKKNKYFLIQPTLSINHSNIANLKKEIKGGNIIYLNSNLSNSEVKLIITNIKYNNLQIMYLSDLIKE